MQHTALSLLHVPFCVFFFVLMNVFCHFFLNGSSKAVDVPVESPRLLLLNDMGPYALFIHTF